MRNPDLAEYASAVVGFPIKEGDKITLEESVTGIAGDQKEYTSEKGADAIVSSIQILPIPSQLTIMVQIVIDAEQELYLWEMFSEADKDPQFPFVRWMAPEERRALAEAKAKSEAEKAEKTSTTSTPTTTSGGGASHASAQPRPQQHQPGHHHRGPWSGHGGRQDPEDWQDYY